MDNYSSNDLDEAIRLTEAGQLAEARALLTGLVTADESNEPAWELLSQIAEDDEDRRICLENLLTLNPYNKNAANELAALEARHAIQVQRLNYQQESDYEDRWQDESARLCGFCAAQISGQDKRCPDCRRNLIGWIFRYEKPSNYLALYQIILGGLSLLLFVEVAVLFARDQATGFLIHQIIFGLVTAALAVAIHWRRSWLHIVSIATLVYLAGVRLLAGIVFRVDGITLDWLIDVDVRLNNLADWMMALTTVGQLLLIIGGLVLAVGVIPADFDRRYFQHIAKVGNSKKDAAGYYLTGRRYAKKGQWATAARYWQRATATAPAQISYHKALAEAYGRLGFHERCLDTLRWAHDNCRDDGQRLELEGLIDNYGQLATDKLDKM